MAYDKYLTYNIDTDIDNNISKLKNNLGFTYNEITNGSKDGIFSDFMESKIVYLNKKDTFKGSVIGEIQKKIALVFYYRNYNNIFKKYYIDDSEYREALTSGIYGPKTTLAIMQFQSIYMKSTFSEKWDSKYGFGMFGENTKNKLDTLYKSAKKSLINSNRTYQARTNTAIAGVGFY